MVFRKNCMSGVYENVFETSEISLLLSLRDGLLFTICVRIPCSTPWEINFIEKNGFEGKSEKFQNCFQGLS